MLFFPPGRATKAWPKARWAKGHYSCRAELLHVTCMGCSTFHLILSVNAARIIKTLDPATCSSGLNECSKQRTQTKRRLRWSVLPMQLDAGSQGDAIGL